jgi:hypothetical protein
LFQADLAATRRCLEQTNEDLRDRHQNAHRCEESISQELKQQRGVINDVHKQILAASKGLKKTTS